MAKPFLYSVAETYLKEFGNNLHHVRFVFPNRRAGVFFQKYLGQLIEKPIFLPEITTISDFIHSLSDIEKADQLDLLFRLFHIYNQHSSGKETFDEFYFWGNVLLNDFDEIDKFYVDAEKLYSNMVALKEIDAAFSGLEKEQEEAIKAFWLNFQEHKQPELKELFLKNWAILYPVYSRFKKALLDDKTGYEGMVYRWVVDHLPLLEAQDNNKTIVFAGFNALNHCEEVIFDFFRNAKKAQFCWDYTKSPYMNDENQAVTFMKKYTKRYPQKENLHLEFEPVVELNTISVPSVTGQAYLSHHLLKDKLNHSPEELTKSVLILSDESLLINTLYSLPNEISALNITMGYPIKSSIALGLLNTLVKLQRNKRLSKNSIAYYSQNVQDLLSHEWIKLLDNKGIRKPILNKIVHQNLVYWSPEENVSAPLYGLLFLRKVSTSNYVLWMIEVFELLLDKLVIEEDQDAEIITKNEDAIGMLEKEILFFIITVLTRLSTQIKKFKEEISSDILARIIKRTVENQTIPFEGEPLSGFQIMGVLESRTIDFEEVTFLSFNERIFPKKSPDNTFIPYNLRKGYGLTTSEYYDAMYSYYFYRLLQRAKKVTLIYNTSQSGIYPGEPSRYLLQLKYIYRAAIKEQSIILPFGTKSSAAISIKDNNSTRFLTKYQINEEKYLSASAINTYIDCGLKFYFTYIKGLKEEDEVEEEIDQRVFGSIFHDAIEKLYEPFENQEISKETLQKLMHTPKIDHHLKNAMAKYYFKVEVEKVEIKGQFLIIFNVLKKYIKKTVETDTQFTPFIYKKGEEKIVHRHSLNDDSSLFLGGFIDRVDEVNQFTRIIDYKTGSAIKSEMSFSDIEQIFTPHKRRPKYVFQTLFYMVLYKKKYPHLITKPGIYFLRNLYRDFHWAVTQKSGKVEMDSNSPFLVEFENRLTVLLEELVSGKAEFKQTEVIENCAYCSFKTICMR